MRPAAAALAIAVLLGGRSAPAGGGLDLRARIDGRPLPSSTDARPVLLDAGRPAEVQVHVLNRGRRPVTVATVRLEGRVAGVAFFAYDTAVGMTVRAGAGAERRFLLDMDGVGRRVTGLVPARLVVLSPSRQRLAAQSLVADVDGRLASDYGAFALGVAAATALLAAGAVLARPARAPVRAARFALPGAGLGLLAAFALGVLRLAAPRPPLVAALAVGAAAVLGVAGWAAPGPRPRSRPPAPRPGPAGPWWDAQPAGGRNARPPNEVDGV